MFQLVYDRQSRLAVLVSQNLNSEHDPQKKQLMCEV